MTASIKSRLIILELQLSKACKTNVELVIRGLNEFTICATGPVKNLDKAKAFLSKSKRIASWKAVYDEELNESFGYFSTQD